MALPGGSIKKAVGQQIRTLRKRQGLSQEGFAKKCGLHWTYIGGLERGERNPTLTTLYRVAGGLGVRLNSLIDPRSFPQPETGQETKEARLLRLLRKKGGDSVDLATKVVRDIIHWRERYGRRRK